MSVSQIVKIEPPVFSFKQQNPDCYYIGVTHSFPPDSPAPEQLLPNQTTSLPTFNHDQNHFTPSFILTTDKDYYKLNLHFERQKFEEKMQQAQFELSNYKMYVVNPAPRFCQICRQSYEDYSEHIQEKSHGRALTQTQGNRWILDVCSLLSRKEKQIKKQCKGMASKTQPRGMTRVKKKENVSCNSNAVLSTKSKQCMEKSSDSDE